MRTISFCTNQAHHFQSVHHRQFQVQQNNIRFVHDGVGEALPAIESDFQLEVFRKLVLNLTQACQIVINVKQIGHADFFRQKRFANQQLDYI